MNTALPNVVSPTKSSSQQHVPLEIKRMREEAAFNASLKKLHKKCETEKVILKHTNNMKEMLTFVPQISNKKWFLSNSKKPGGLFDQITFMSKNVRDKDTNDPVAVNLILETLYTKYPKTIRSFLGMKHMIDKPVWEHLIDVRNVIYRYM